MKKQMCASVRTAARRIIAAAALSLLTVPLVAAPARAATVASSLRVYARDMSNTLSWSRPQPRPGITYAGYYVYRATSPKGHFDRVTPKPLTTTYFTHRVSATGPAYYIVRAVGTNGLVYLITRVRENTTVMMSKAVSSNGATLTAANGDITLALDPGTFAATTVVGVREVSSAPATPSGAIRVAPYFSFTPDGAQLAKPARATVRYKVPVTQFQVAGTLAKYINMVSYNPTLHAWQTTLTSIDQNGGTFTGFMTHFSYWTGDVVQPHGTPPNTANYCQAICHNLVAGPNDLTPIVSTDKQICYNCHGNTSASLPPAGTNGPNIEAEFIDCADQSFEASTQSRHPVPGAELACVRCHNQHRNPTQYYKLLRATDALSGLPVEVRKNNPLVGSAYCWACHGTTANLAIELTDPGYWLRSGADHKTDIIGTPHEILTAPTSSGINCMACHADHASDTTKLVRTSVAATSTANDRTLCLACHTAASSGYPATSRVSSEATNAGYPSGGTWPGKTAYGVSAHATSTVVYPGTSYAGGDCKNCHGPHGTGRLDMLVADYNSPKGYDPGDSHAAYDMCIGACHDSSGPGPDIRSSYATGAEYAGHKITFNPDVIESSSTAYLAAGAKLPCYECHNPHGSTRGNYKMFNQERSPGATVTSQRDFCTRCHRASDSSESTPTVAGMNMKKLPGTVGQHELSDTSNCVPCHGGDAHAAAPHGGGSGGSGCAECHGQTGSHAIHVSGTDPRGPGAMDCGDCHDTDNFPSFADGNGLGGTNVCNTCHSPGGDYNGVDSTGTSVGAKDNWASKVYETTTTIQSGKEKWCAGCHDKSPSQVLGVEAPGVIGDETSSSIYGGGFGFYKTGHGLPSTSKYPANGFDNGADLDCEACHDYSNAHIDGTHRTFTSAGSPDTYRTSYRLKRVGGNNPMEIPWPGMTANSAGMARLCYSCHDSGPYLTAADHRTNFWNDNRGDINYNLHYYHLSFTNQLRWAPDWRGTQNSRISCVTCHNVHGSQYLAMIRDGELISDYQQRRPGLRIWYWDSVISQWNETNPDPPAPEDVTLAMSEGWVWRGATSSNLCGHCHANNNTLDVQRALWKSYATGPALRWTGTTGYTDDGANPDSGPGPDGFTFKVTYSDANNDAPSYVRLRIDSNDDGDCDDAGEAVDMDPDAPGDNTYQDGNPYNTTVQLAKEGDDVLPYYFETSDGSTVATGPAQRTVTITNSAPSVPWTGEAGYVNDGVNPNSGTMDLTNFEFRITYRDLDGEAPSGGVNLHVDKNDDGDYGDAGELVTMSDMGDLSYILGKRYNHSTTLGYGNDGFINYYFDATDGIDTAMSTICTATVTTATNHAPSLAWTGEASYVSDGVDPDTAPGGKPFFFRVAYTDEDNDAPGTKQVWVDKNSNGNYDDSGEKVTMDDTVTSPPNDGDYTDGEIFAEKIYLPSETVRTINYCFYFTDPTSAEATGVQLAVRTLSVYPARDVPGEFGTIQSAISTATAGETILVGDGTYAAFAYNNKDVTVDSVNGPESTIIDGGGSGTVVNFNQYSGNSTDSTLTGFTVRNGTQGISTAVSWARLADCIIENNTTYGIQHTCNSSYPITLDDCVVRNNTGPGLYVSNNTAIVTATDCSFTGNTAGTGGAIMANGGNITIDRSVLSNNQATTNNGGAFYAGGVITLNLRDSIVTSNTAVLEGGGLYFSGAASTNVTVERSVLAANSASSGGGIRGGIGTYYFKNCSVTGNDVTSYGGGAYISGGNNVNFVNCTLAGNDAAYGGGLYAATSTDAHPKVHNCIMWGNNSGSSAYEQIDSNSDMNRNRIQVRYTDIDQTYTNFNNQAGNMTSNPLFVSAVSYALAPTTAGDYHIQSGSPCIGAADASIAPDDDIDGDSRLPHLAGTNDMGSDEVP